MSTAPVTPDSTQQSAPASQPNAPLNPLVAKVRAAYPGAYDDLDDATLTKTILAKYPQYSDLAASTPAAIPQGTISAPQGGAGGWLKDLEGDVKYGTGLTAPGRFLRALGAPGLYSGNSEQTGNFMGATPALGPIHTAQGIVETPSHPILGPLHAAAGALETATLPSGFMAPEAAETAASLPGKLTDLIPSAAHAGENFNAVKEAVGSHPIDMTDALSNSTMAVQKLADTGGSMPMVVRKFLTRITNPDAPPLTYDDARLFYSNASRLSADEQQRLTPVVRRAVGQFVSDLGDSIAGVAERGGKLQQFQDAMQEYRNAMRLRDVGENVKNAAIEGAKRAIPAAGVYYGIKKLLSGPSVGK